MNNNSPHLGRLGLTANPLKRARTPVLHDDTSIAGESAAEKELNPVQERRQKLMRDLYARSERMVEKLLDGNLQRSTPGDVIAQDSALPNTSLSPAKPKSTPQSKKRAAREIAEDDYDDEDEEDDNEAASANKPSPAPVGLQKTDSFHKIAPAGSRSQPAPLARSTSKESASSPEEARKKLEEEKKATEDAAKESFLTTIYTVENDREAMLEQQKLDELDRQVETEISAGAGTQQGVSQAQSSLSKSALGSAQLLMPNLVARLDTFRSKVSATDAQIKALLSNARIGGGKWANPDKVGQEELYESLEQVLGHLKGQVHHSAPFLQSVKKKDYPEYHKIITKPMDIGTMLKKLNTRAYRSKKEFTDDLDQIWANCYKFNTDPSHNYRKKADHMKREASKLTPLIPDITVRDRAEVEAEEREERRRQFEDSDDDDAPIAATRGRKAPNKGAKGGTAARKAPPAAAEESPDPEDRPRTQSQRPAGGVASLRAETDPGVDGSQNGLGTPPIGGNSTPLGAGGLLDGPGATNGVDNSELESVNATEAGALDQIEEPAEEDEEYKVWKQVTMKDRARIAAERNRLFYQNRLNSEEPALLRSKAGMRRWMRQQRSLLGEAATKDLSTVKDQSEGADTLAEGMGTEEDSALPDYYQAMSGVPAISQNLKWVEDDAGQVVDQRDQCLRLLPSKHYSSTSTREDTSAVDGRVQVSEKTSLAGRLDANMRQLQETRKIMAKIGMVKQMQMQTQTYQNQFQKYEPQQFEDAEIDAMPVSDEGPYIQPTVSHSALQRSVAKMFYHAGFEDFQPSALDAATDAAAEFMQRITSTFLSYHQHPKVNPAVPESFIEPTATANAAASPIPIINAWQPRFTYEEKVLHTLNRVGHDLESLSSYVEDEIPRIGQKLAAQHEATKQHYADLLRPALDPAVAAKDGGVGAFNDGSEQFLAGDFAEDLDEDFFGFAELGLDAEIGRRSVPVHLLQSRFNTLNQQAAGPGVGAEDEVLMAEPPRWSAVTSDNIENEIGIVQDFFKDKLEKTGGAALTEDEELPPKQRFPKPRLPPTGKISSPRKRPLREQQQQARKKRRLEIEAERERDRQEQGGGENGGGGTNEDGSGGGTVAVANSGENDTVEMSGALNTNEGSAVVTAEEGTEVNSEEPSRRESVAAQPTVNGTSSSLPNGVLTNGTTNHDKHEQQHTPTLTKPLKLDKPKEDQPPDTDPEKRGSLPIAAH